MAAADLAPLALVLLLGVGGGLLLYVAVRAASRDRPVMDRGRAERAARRDREDGE